MICFYDNNKKLKPGYLLHLVFALLLAASVGLAQEITPFENDIPFGIRMNFFKGPADSTLCLVTIRVDNRNLVFFRGENFFEARYEIFLSLRNTETRFLAQRNWEKSLRVTRYDETSLAQQEDPLRDEMDLLPGKYEGFIEIKDFHANTYGNGRISIIVPDFSSELPKLSTPLFYEPLLDSVYSVPAVDLDLASPSLKYPSGKPIFLLVDVYSDSTAPPDGWVISAEVLKSLRVFPRVTASLENKVLSQRKVLKIPTKTMELGEYEIEVTLRDKHNNSMARASSFTFNIIKSPEWLEQNYEEEVRYLKYLATRREMNQLLSVAEKDRPTAIKSFWDKMDPVPATAVNELKIQYFERIEYANRNFTTEKTEGWETNMGEVYIMLGPPTEIYGSRINQIWVYERENLVFYFFNHNLRNRHDFDEYVRDHRVRNN